jgi:hypothetical protein
MGGTLDAGRISTVTYDQFSASLKHDEPPVGLPPGLRALWLDAKGGWHAAHEVAQEIETIEGARIHAYLHRKEGDVGNAHYWYRHAAREPVTGSLDREWTDLVRDLLG